MLTTLDPGVIFRHPETPGWHPYASTTKIIFTISKQYNIGRLLEKLPIGPNLLPGPGPESCYRQTLPGRFHWGIGVPVHLDGGESGVWEIEVQTPVWLVRRNLKVAYVVLQKSLQ